MNDLEVVNQNFKIKQGNFKIALKTEIELEISITLKITNMVHCKSAVW